MPDVVAIVSADSQEHVDLPPGLLDGTYDGTRDDRGHLWLDTPSTAALRAELVGLAGTGGSSDVVRHAVDLIDAAERAGTGIAVIVAGPAGV